MFGIYVTIIKISMMHLAEPGKVEGLQEKHMGHSLEVHVPDYFIRFIIGWL